MNNKICVYMCVCVCDSVCIFSVSAARDVRVCVECRGRRERGSVSVSLSLWDAIARVSPGLHKKIVGDDYDGMCVCVCVCWFLFFLCAMCVCVFSTFIVSSSICLKSRHAYFEFAVVRVFI